METEPSDSIHVQELEVFARVGVTDNERNRPQRLTVSITVWPKRQFEDLTDDITRTINYSALCAAARDFIGDRADNLIETIATGLADHLMDIFPTYKVRIELRKFVIPDAQYAAVTVVRIADHKN